MLWGPKGTEGSSWGPIPLILRNTASVLLSNSGLSMVEIPRFLSDARFRKKCLSSVKDFYVLDFWRGYDEKRHQDQDSLTSSILNKLDEFLSQPLVRNIVGQSQSTVNMREFMDEGRIVLIPLSLGRLGKAVVSLLGSLIVQQTLNAALSREDLPGTDRRPFYLYVDEFQRFATPSNQAIHQGIFRPFEANETVVICSYQFARSKAGDVANTPWDLVVIDDVYRLRNVYGPSNIIANTLKLALASRPKLLLTATPLQNSILELFGLVSVIDDRVFGDLQSFREQFSNLNQTQVSRFSRSVSNRSVPGHSGGR